VETFDEGADALTTKESWQAIHATMDDARSSLYLAGSATILLLWGVIISVGFLTQFSILTLAPDFAEQRPWFTGPLWGGIGMAGGVGSGIIGHRAGQRLAAGDAARRAGLRVFFFWTSFVVGGFFILMVAGLLNADSADDATRAWIAIVALAYVLFGIITRVVIALVGLGFAAAYFVPHYLLGDAALAVTGVLSLVTFVLGFAWIRRTGEW